MPNEKLCTRCNCIKSVSDFNKDSSSKDGYFIWCRDCFNRRQRELRYLRKENSPMTKNKTCSSFLGVHIAERVLSRVFNNVEVMPYGTPGYDFICGQGYKIDVKSACRLHVPTVQWMFNIKYNTIPDYFLLIAFDNRDNLNPEHLWLIPGNILNTKHGVVICKNAQEKWIQYERPIEPITKCCNVLRWPTTDI